MSEITDLFSEFLLGEYEKHRHEWVHGKALFKGHDTFGLPFDFMLDHVELKLKMRPDIGGLKSELRANYGWDDKRINAELRRY